MEHKKLTTILITTTFSLTLIVCAISTNSKDEKLQITDNNASQEDNTQLIRPSTCEENNCTYQTFSIEMKKYYEDDYPNFSLQDLNGDGENEVILSSAQEGSVNNCSKIYTYDNSHKTFINMNDSDRDICNFSVHSGYLISSYRSGAKWYEDIYRIDEKKLVLTISDACVGCGEVSRTRYNEEGSQEFIVTDAPNYTDRAEISTNVIKDKTHLYSQPSTSKTTKSYLIKNDRVMLLSYSAKDDVDWYKVRYHTAKGKDIDGWLKCEDIAYCKENHED